jgi:hypothetical protein
VLARELGDLDAAAQFSLLAQQCPPCTHGHAEVEGGMFGGFAAAVNGHLEGTEEGGVAGLVATLTAGSLALSQSCGAHQFGELGLFTAPKLTGL